MTDPQMVTGINISEGLFVDVDGSVYPITNWYDEDGDECPRERAVSCVAGTGGCWFAIFLPDYEVVAQQ